ncbi:hypothetical protein [Aequorivita capsosiphonis]|uniref:hypothetical protein n=1 Tax=Aequorivita capsosiphonis TaxID=487317 RepID=UPI0003F73E54|nr:hypothetical protein [Aequorivita capsosiphonis]
MGNGKSAAHNKGQSDRASGNKYNNGSSLLDYLESSSSRLKNTDDKAKAYRKGWNNK